MSDASLLFLAFSLAERGQFAEALACFEKLAASAPLTEGAVFVRANAHRALRQLPQALAAYDAVLQTNPAHSGAHCNRALCLMVLRRPDAALDGFDRALSLDAPSRPALVGRASALHALHRLPEALEAYQRVLAISPADSNSLFKRAIILRQLRQAQAAIRAFRDLLDVAPDFPYAPGHLLQDRLQLCDWTDYEEDVKRIEAGLSHGRQVCLPWVLLWITNSAEAQRQAASIYVSDKRLGRAVAPVTLPKARRARLRVAYVSADFCDHPVAYAIAGVIANHDRGRIESVGVCLRAPDDSPIGRRLRASFDQFLDVSGEDEQSITTTLQNLEIDIAVDLMGFTAAARPTIFAHRIAPIQVNYLGFPGTLGMPNADYIIADRVVLPIEHQSFFSERAAYLTRCFHPCGEKPIADRMPIRAEYGLPAQGFVFCSFNAHYKISPDIFAVWMRLLHTIDGSVLWLASGPEEAQLNLQREAADHGIAADRLVFACRVPDLADHLARHRLADLFLDTAPYNAHSTAGDALWAGLPVVTYLGGSFPGRVAASLLTFAGFPELVADDQQAYEELARQLAGSPEQLGAIRERLVRGRDTNPIFDAAGYCAELEAAYLAMWSTHNNAAGHENGPTIARSSHGAGAASVRWAPS